MSNGRVAKLKSMTVADVRARIEEIRWSVCDDETAHIKEDDLLRDVLWAISFGAENAADLAAAALATTRLKSEGRCA